MALAGHTQGSRRRHKSTAQRWGETWGFDPFCAGRRPGAPHYWAIRGSGPVPGGAHRREARARPSLQVKRRPGLRKRALRRRFRTGNWCQGVGFASENAAPEAVGRRMGQGPRMGRKPAACLIFRMLAPVFGPYLGPSPSWPRGYRRLGGGHRRDAHSRGWTADLALALRPKTSSAAGFWHWKLLSWAWASGRQVTTGGRRALHEPTSH